MCRSGLHSPGLVENLASAIWFGNVLVTFQTMSSRSLEALQFYWVDRIVPVSKLSMISIATSQIFGELSRRGRTKLRVGPSREHFADDAPLPGSISGEQVELGEMLCG